MKQLLLLVSLAITFVAQGQLEPLAGMDTLKVYRSLEAALNAELPVKRLDLTRQKLKYFPEEIFQLTELEELILDRNKIRVIPGEITKLKKLRHLSISRNNLDKFPPHLCSVRSLERLNLSQNEIAKLPDEIHRLINLKELILWSNVIGYYPTTLIRMKELKYVDLLHNEMNDQEQERVRNLLKDATINLSPPCDCTFYDEDDE